MKNTQAKFCTVCGKATVQTTGAGFDPETGKPEVLMVCVDRDDCRHYGHRDTLKTSFFGDDVLTCTRCGRRDILEPDW